MARACVANHTGRWLGNLYVLVVGSMLFGGRKNTSNKEDKRITVLAPMDGELIQVTAVDDPTFSEEMLGRGVAIRPSGGKAVSPVSGTVTQMFDTGHAVTVTSDDGVEILIHIGLNTVELKGEHFKKCANGGDRVVPGDLLIEFDGASIKAAGYDTVTPIVVCNSDDFSSFVPQADKIVAEGEEIIYLLK